MKHASLAVALVLAAPLVLMAEDWPAFRGAHGDGVAAEDEEVPLEWSRDQNVRWRTALAEPSNASPIVSNLRVFVTSASPDGRERHLTCYSRFTGRQLWRQTVEHDEVELTHHTNPYGASTPVADGRRVVVWHGSAGLHCYDFAGKKLWSRDLGEFRHIWGYGSSPILHAGRVILNAGPGERQFLAAVDLESDEIVWQTDEPGGASGENKAEGGWVGTWSTPLVALVDGQEQIICPMPTRVVACDPATGDVLWFVSGLSNKPRGELVYTSVVVSGDLGVALGGFNGPAMGFRLGGSGDMTETNRLWRVDKGTPQRIGSPVIVDGYAYQANAGPGTIECFELQTGDQVWRTRGDGGNYWGSPVLASSRLYVTNQKGTTVVFEPRPDRFEQLAANDLGEDSNSTPAISDGAIFLQTFEGLYCIAEGRETLTPEQEEELLRQSLAR